MSRISLVAVSIATLLALGGCGSDAGTSERATSARPRATPSPTATTVPAPDASSSVAPSATATRHGGRHKVGTLVPRTRAAADQHLLDADHLPRIGGRTWTVDAGAPTGAVGACQKTALETIGALEATGRAYTAEDGITATQVVARFADSRSAWRAHQVLTAWRDDCESRVRRATVGPLEPVTVHTGSADTYRGSFRSRSTGLGILRTGRFLTVVEVAAGESRYPTAWNPARVAVRRIARTF